MRSCLMTFEPDKRSDQFQSKNQGETSIMKFNNIERNILYMLGDEWLKSGSLGPYETEWIFDTFSDIPDNNMRHALRSVKERGLVELTSKYRHISLTQKGLSKIKVIDLPENGKLPFPGKLE